MSETHRSIRLDSESDEFGSTSAVAVRPRGWRDAWSVLRGTYKPRVKRTRSLTVAGAGREIKAAWGADTLRSALDQPSPLFDLFRDDV